MVINGKERGFLFSIGAYICVGEMCPSGDISKLTDIIQGDNPAENFKNTIKVATILSERYERQKEFNGGVPERSLTEKELMTLPMSQLKDLVAAIMSTMSKDIGQDIEAEESKGKNAEAAEK